MNTKEKKVFLELCNFKKTQGISEETIIKNATPEVLGHLFFNRMQSVAYGIMKERGLIGKVNREFRNSLANAYIQNKEKNNSFFCCLDKLTDILSDCEGRYAMLKGALLCGIYPEGYRTSNDIDLLVRPEDVSNIGNVLNKSGFLQGNIRNGEFIKASRADIIESKMTRGETIPYILEVNMPYMKYLEVDINFSLDYKNSDANTLCEMLKKAQKIKFGEHSIFSLNKYDFFIHLCLHLFKEATTYPWVEMKRDMTLYKYLDIYMLYVNYGTAERKALFKRIKELGFCDVCSAVLLWVDEIFSLEDCIDREELKRNIDPNDNILLKVIDPKKKKTYYYTEEDAKKRFFTTDRTKILKEIII